MCRAILNNVQGIKVCLYTVYIFMDSKITTFALLPWSQWEAVCATSLVSMGSRLRYFLGLNGKPFALLPWSQWEAVCATSLVSMGSRLRYFLGLNGKPFALLPWSQWEAVGHKKNMK